MLTCAIRPTRAMWCGMMTAFSSFRQNRVSSTPRARRFHVSYNWRIWSMSNVKLSPVYADTTTALVYFTSCTWRLILKSMAYAVALWSITASHLFAHNKNGRPYSAILCSTDMSNLLGCPSVASKTTTTTWAKRICSMDRPWMWLIKSRSARLCTEVIPAVSINFSLRPLYIHAIYTESRVVCRYEEARFRSNPTNRLSRLVLPLLARPTIATRMNRSVQLRSRIYSIAASSPFIAISYKSQSF